MAVFQYLILIMSGTSVRIIDGNSATSNCKSMKIQEWTFPYTAIGQAAYSLELCSYDTANAGHSQATARCTERAVFEGLEIVECDLTLDDIWSNVSKSLEEKHVQTLASSTQILTSKPAWLTASDITSATGIVSIILSSTRTLNKVKQHFILFLINRWFLGNTATFTANGVQLKSKVSKQDNNPSDVQIFIKLSDESKQNADITVGFVVYNNDHLFQSKTFKSSLGSNRKVISGSLSHAAPKQVNLKFTPKNVPNKILHNFACVFWDYGINDWSTRGCFKVNSSEGLQCQCNHMTNFAVLMSFKEDHKYAEPLSWVSTIGCCLSIMGLIITILFQIMTRKSRKSTATVLLVSICFSMTIFYFLFLFGIVNPNSRLKRDIRVSEENVIPRSDLHQDPDRGPCTALTALMQYFLLATFTWNTLFALHIFMLFKFTFSSPSTGFQGISIATGWGLPAVVVATTLGVSYRVDGPLHFRREEFTNKDSLKKKFMAIFNLAVLLGLTWILGYLVLATTDSSLNSIFSIAFCVCNTAQGLYIFIVFTVRTPDFRRMILTVANKWNISHLALHREVYSISDSCLGAEGCVTPLRGEWDELLHLYKSSNHHLHPWHIPSIRNHTYYIYNYYKLHNLHTSSHYQFHSCNIPFIRNYIYYLHSYHRIHHQLPSRNFPSIRNHTYYIYIYNYYKLHHLYTSSHHQLHSWNIPSIRNHIYYTHSYYKLHPLQCNSSHHYTDDPTPTDVRQRWSAAGWSLPLPR
ncbi:adhesion G-protein coupled receptor G7-like [Sardina pilchardus]|uniref:adhesion G-protein coupled receptor G7-like n=1 Tax=Sardina pilchardus TaxID=27697 RepID=UPI002E0E56E7